jgi:hypothetical protein
MSSTTDIVAITGGGSHSWIIINALFERFGRFPVILEPVEPPAAFWARRKRMLGAWTVLRQKAAFAVMGFTARGSQRRIAELVESEGLALEPPPDLEPVRVPSVNSEEARAALVALRPRVVFVVSTRMIGRKTLAAVPAPFINYHSGINPAYRGIFGCYFALANGDPGNFGGTVHLVDEGVDTGGILYQCRTTPTPRDTIHTYVVLVAAASRGIVVAAIEDALAGTLKPITVDLPSRQYFGPTIDGYLWAGLTRGVW